jgi:hypothetical protein
MVLYHDQHNSIKIQKLDFLQVLSMWDVGKS